MKKRFIFFAVATAALVVTGVALLRPQAVPLDLPELVTIPAGEFTYRAAGDFRIGTKLIDAPVQQRFAENAVEIMKFPVSQSDYANCVADGACYASSSKGLDNTAQIDVNYSDVTAYAKWYSDKTGSHWRLPTDEEWVRAAGDRFVDDALGTLGGDGDPSDRWIANYRRAVKVRGDADSTLRPLGGFGENNLGVADISGNVWEWTETCFQNGKVSEDGSTLIESSDYCGVRSVQGKHRAFIITFVRDAKVGGCAVGIPPDYLGFRLVREARSG